MKNAIIFLGVEAFNKTNISETILRRLLKQDIVFHIKKNKDWRNDPACVIYQRGKASDYFVLVLEGRVEVTIGQENLVFESGPFTYFGTQALAQNVGVGKYSKVIFTNILVIVIVFFFNFLNHVIIYNCRRHTNTQSVYKELNLRQSRLNAIEL